VVARFILLLAVLLSACSPDDPSEHVVRMAVASAPVNLDPRYASDAVSARVNRLLYRRLVEFDSSSRAVPGLATWEAISPCHYRFELGAEGRAFHDGTRLTAQDIKATFDSIIAAATASPHRSTLELIDHIEVVDTEHVDFFLNRDDPLFPGYLSIGILPAHLIAKRHPFAEQPVGSGPYRFVERPHDGRLVLERRTDGQRLEFIEVKDPTVRVLKLLRGEVDMLQNDLPPELADYLARREEVKTERGPGSNFSYLGFNLEDPVVGQLPVRRAIAHAIDREAIVRHLLGGGATPAQALLPPDHWAGTDLPAYRYDPELARELLARAGYGPEHPLSLVYKTSTDPFRVRLATVIQDQLADIGIDMRISSYDWGTFFGDIKAGRFQMYSLTWVGIKTPDIYRYAFHSNSIPPEGANRGRYANPRADTLIEAAEQGRSIQVKVPVYRDLQRLLLEDLPYIPLWYEDHFVAYRPDIVGYRLARDGNYDGLLDTTRAAEAEANR
jgi:peptide/nickel transport system substrate-binding protein